MTPMVARMLLSEWFADRRAKSVRLIHVDAPAKDPHYRAVIVHEAAFEPASLDMARVELWITEHGEVSIGFETWARVAQRVGIKGTKPRFAAGHEPLALTEDGLVAILDVIARGEIAIRVGVLPILGLWKTNAIVLPATLAALTSRGYTGHLATRWLHPVKLSQMEDQTNVLRYRPWE